MLQEFCRVQENILGMFKEKIPSPQEIMKMAFLITARECPGMATFALWLCSASSCFSRVLAGPWLFWMGITRVLVHHPGRTRMERI